MPAIHRRRPRANAIALAAALALALLTPPDVGALTYVWSGGTGAWGSGANWAGGGGSAPNGTSDWVYIDGGGLLDSFVTLSSSAGVGRVTIDAGDTLGIVTGGSLTLYGGQLVNNGQLGLTATTGNALLQIAASTLLSGTGTTRLDSSSSGYRAIVAGSGSRTLTIASGHTLRGAGDLGNGTYGMLAVVNQGTVIAEGGTLSTYGSFDNSAGLVRVAGGATLSASGISGGTVQSLGAASLVGSFSSLALAGDFATSSLSLADARIDNVVRATGTNALTTSGTLTINGELQVTASSSSIGRMQLNGHTTLAGPGATVLSSDASGYRAMVTGGLSRTLTIASGHTVRGAGDLGNGTYGYLTVVNQGTVLAEGGTLSTYGSFDNLAGLVQVANGATLASGGITGGTVQSLGSATLNGTVRDLALSGDFSTSGLSLANVRIDNLLKATGNNALQTSGTLTVNGELRLAPGSGSLARLQLDGNTTLAGPGATVLTTDASGYRAAINGGLGRTLTIASGHTLRGAGDLGDGTYGTLAVVNQGTVIAAGGTLSTYGSFDNAAGLVQVASGATLSASPITGGTVQSLGSATLTGSVSSATLNGNFATSSLNLTNTRIANTLRASNGTLSTTGTITVDGQLQLTGGNTGHGLMTLSANTTLAGTGSTVLSTAPSGYGAIVAGGSNRTLTIAAGHTLRGAGDMGSSTYGTLAVVNQGTVLAEGGTLSTYGSFDNGAGLVQVAGGATLSAGGITGGTVQSLGSATLTGSISSATLNGNFATSSLSLTNTRIANTLRASNGTLSTTGTLTVDGELQLAGGNTGHGLMTLSANTTLAGTGSTVLSTAPSGYGAIVAGGSNRTLTIAAGHTLRGAGNMGSSTYGTLAVINQGTVIAEGGTLATLGSLDNSAGLVQVANGALLSTSGTLKGGTLQGLGTNSQVSGNGLRDLTLAGTLRVATNSAASVAGIITNQGTLTVAGSSSGFSQLSLSADTTFSGAGSIVLNRDSSGYGGMIIGGSGSTLTIAAGQTVRGAGSLGNASNGALGLVNHGTVVAEGGTLSSYTGGLGFDNRDGTLVVAAGSTMSFASAPLLSDASLLRIGVAGTSGSASVGQFSIAGNAAFDGQVVLDLSAYQAAIGDSFSFASYSGSYSGAFDAVSAAGYELSVSYANHLVTATITAAVPEPQTYALLMSGIAAIAWVARRRRTRA